MSETLRCKIIVYLHGKILADVPVLNQFPIEILSQVSFILNKQTFILGENVIIEQEMGQQLFFINNGRVALIHKHTKTFVKDLVKDNYFGEIGFFSDIHRQISVKARDFTEVLILDRLTFLQLANEVSEEIILQFQKIKFHLESNPKNYKYLETRCYVC